MRNTRFNLKLLLGITGLVSLLIYLGFMYHLLSRPIDGPKKYFVTFGNHRFIKSRERITKEAQKIKVFDTVLSYDEKFIATLPHTVQEFIQHNKRGYGYWVWKSFVVLQALESMQMGEILVYADAGCQIKAKGKKRLQEYFNMLLAQDKYDIISFKTEYMEKQYTKMDIFNKLNMNTLEDLNAPHYMATCFIIRKSAHSINMVKQWVALSQEFHLIDDTPSIAANDPSFIENRHDQSLWSLIRKKEGSIVLEDETEVGKFKNAPILAKRIVE